jgi:opacity protein-like surface antigen
MDGWIYGGQIGYNHQFGRVVVGSELSATFGDVDGSRGEQNPCFTATPNVPSGTVTRDRRCNAEQTWSVQWLNKLGLAHGRFMGYIMGGVAVTHVDIDRSIFFERTAGISNIGVTTTSWSGGTEYVGVVFGGGIQVALSDNLSLGVEYLRSQYASADTLTTGTLTTTVGGPFTGALSANAINDLNADTVRAVLNYKFGHREVGPLK